MQENKIQSTQDNTSNKQKNKNLPYKNIVYIFIFLIIILSLTLLFLKNTSQKNPNTNLNNLTETIRPTSQVSPYAQSVLSLLPNPINFDSSGRGNLDVNIETGSNEVTAVQLELQYDPTVITSVQIKASDFFANPVELLKRIDAQNGRITYMIGIGLTQEPISGSGTVAKISFTKKSGIQTNTTVVKFVKTTNSESLVAATGIDQSVLKQTVDATINL